MKGLLELREFWIRPRLQLYVFSLKNSQGYSMWFIHLQDTIFCSTVTHISLSLETKASAKLSLQFRIMNYHSDYCISLK